MSQSDSVALWAKAQGYRRFSLGMTPLARLESRSLALIGLFLCAAPWCAEPRLAVYNTTILGTPYTYSHAFVYQLFELRYCPLVGAVFFFGSWLALYRGQGKAVPLAKALFAAGTGFLGFGLFRFFLLFAYEDKLVWFVAWEEYTELLAILLIGYLLWVFRRGLLPAPSGSEVESRASA